MTTSGIELLKQGTATPAPSSKGTVRLEGDINGRPRIVNDQGDVTGVGAPGDPLSLAEQLVPPTTLANEVKVYPRRVDGVLQLFVRDESNGAESEVGAGGGESPYLNGAEYVYIEQDLGTGGSPVEVNTGIVIPLVANTHIRVRAESGSALESNSIDSGFAYFAGGWGAPPSLPGDPMMGQMTSGAAVVLLNYLTGWSLNASGELVFNLSGGWSPNRLYLVVKIAVWYKVLPFAPPSPS